MEHLSPLDASFLDLEDQDPHVSLAIASLAVIDGPAPGHAEFVSAIRARLPLVPRYRQTVRRVPLDLAGPVWVDQPEADLEYHIRRVALPAPGDDLVLCRMIARIMSQRLDRDRPLWEYWVVEGLPEDRWAVLSKVHHCVLDGMAGNELYRLVFDRSPEPREPTPDTWHPAPNPNTATLVGDALSEIASVAANQVRLLTTAVRKPEQAAKYLAGATVGFTALAGSLLPLRPTSLLGPLGQARRYAVARVPVADLIRVAKGFGTSVNDVILSVVTGAFRAVLLERGEEAAPESVRTLVPVNVRKDHEKAIIDNRVSMLLPTLPVEVADPVERLRVMHGRMVELKKSHEIEAGASLSTAAPYEFFGIVDAVVRFGLRLPQRVVGVDRHDADVTADLGTADGRAAMVDAMHRLTGGTVDAVHAVAGLAQPAPATVAVNYFGAVATLEGLRPFLLASTAPRAVVVSSMAALHPVDDHLVAALDTGDEVAALSRAEVMAKEPETLGRLIYTSSKQALSRWVRRQAAGTGWAGASVPLNAVGPGVIATPMTADMIATEEQRAALLDIVPMPLNGIADADTVARLLAWLGGVENTHLCGQVIYIDGGSDVVIRGDSVW